MCETTGLALFDVCRNRHGGAPESVAANIQGMRGGRRRRMREDVFAAIREAGLEGITCKELAELWGVGMNVISGRFTELKLDQRIVKCGRRDGSAAYKEN